MDRCLELKLNKHSNFRTAAVGKHRVFPRRLTSGGFLTIDYRWRTIGYYFPIVFWTFLWKRGQGIDGGGKSCNEGPPSPPTGKNSETSIWMWTFSSYCDLIQHFCLFKFETFFHWGLVSHQFSYFKEHSNYRQKQQLDSALFLGVSLHQTTESRPQCRHQSHQRTKSFQIGPIVLLFIFSALLIVYVGLIIA